MHRAYVSELRRRFAVGFVYMLTEFDRGECGSICYSLRNKEVSNWGKLRPSFSNCQPGPHVAVHLTPVLVSKENQNTLCFNLHINGGFSHRMYVFC
jgi:hypothetical protein